MEDYKLMLNNVYCDFAGMNFTTKGINKKLVGSTDQEKAYNLFKQTFKLTEMEISNIYNMLILEHYYI